MGEHLARASVVRNYNVAAAVFRYAADRDYVGKSPCRTVKPPKVKRNYVHVSTPEELIAWPSFQ